MEKKPPVPPQYYKFTTRDIPSGARPWPDGVRHPKPLGGPVPCPMPDGLYYTCYDDGQLQLLARVLHHQTISWLNLEPGKPAGCDTTESVHCAQRYYEDGRMEDFNPWDDSSPPYPADESFESFVRRQLSLYFR